jgi:hypothetical protein
MSRRAEIFHSRGGEIYCAPARILHILISGRWLDPVFPGPSAGSNQTHNHQKVMTLLERLCASSDVPQNTVPPLTITANP